MDLLTESVEPNKLKASKNVIKVVGNYELNKKLGEGSFARVFSAVHLITGEAYALKIIAKSKVASAKLQCNLDNEILIMRDYIHTNVASLSETFTEGKYIILVMELCQFDLSQFLKKKVCGYLDESLAIPLLLQLSEGLAFLHSKNVIHRDIKPANLLLSASQNADFPVLKISDYGFARQMTETAKMANTPCGTPLYMAPEIYLLQDYDCRVDIWSSGIVYYEMITGRTPWLASSPRELFRSIQLQGMVAPDHITVASRSLLGRLLEISPARRPLTEAFCAAVRRLATLAEGPPSATHHGQSNTLSLPLSLHSTDTGSGMSHSSFVIVGADGAAVRASEPIHSDDSMALVRDCENTAKASQLFVTVADEHMLRASAYLHMLPDLSLSIEREEADRKGRAQAASAASILVILGTRLQSMLMALQSISACDACCVQRSMCDLQRQVLRRMQCIDKLVGDASICVCEQSARRSINTILQGLRTSADAALLQGRTVDALILRHRAKVAVEF